MRTPPPQITAAPAAPTALPGGIFARIGRHRAFLGLLALCLLLVRASGGTWAPLTHLAAGPVGHMHLLSNGTVMVQNDNDGGTYGPAWYLLTPDSAGHYTNGTWTTLSSANYTRLFFASQLLKDGRLFMAGGEYGSGGAAGEIYDPVANTWTTLPAPGHTFSDANSEILPDGRVMVALVEGTLRNTLIYDPVANTWSTGPTLNGIHNESAWVKLPDASILMVDRLSTNAERYLPSTNTWINDSTVPVSLYDSFGDETGPGFLLPNGNVIYFGAMGHTAIYTPSGSAASGTWVAGPDIPNTQGCPDAPGAMLPNGTILLATAPVPISGNVFQSPTSFYEYDYTVNGYTQVNAPAGGLTESGSSFQRNMLVLPDGTVLSSRFSSQLYVYTPSGSPLTSAKPAIASVTQNGDLSYHLTGTQLNGICEGACYGDDDQNFTNYPIVRLTSGGGVVYYARTFNWSSTGVATGSAVVTTEFTVPAAVPPGTYALDVVANGNASAQVSFTYAPGPPTVSSPTQATIQVTSAVLGGNVTSDGGGGIAERGIVYSSTSVNPSPTIGGAGVSKVTSPGATGVFTVNVTGLTQNTGYSFAAYATNFSGTTYTTPVSTFTTPTAVPLAGTKTVGASGNYTSLTNVGGLFDAINNNGITGALSVQVTGSLTAETGAVALNAPSGTTPSLKIFPTGATRVISGNVAGALIRLNGASNVTVDGSLNGTGTDRSLTVTNSNTITPTAIGLISLGTGLGATNDTVRNCNISTGVATTSGYGIAVGGSTPGSSGADNDNVTIQNNSISAAPVGIFASGTSSASAGGDDNLTILGNSIAYSSTLACIGIQVRNALNSLVSQNSVSEQTTSFQFPTAISLETGFVSSSVTRNTVTKSLTTYSGGYSGRGITVGTGTAASALTIANNVIYGVNGSNWSSFGTSAMGIVIGTIGSSGSLSTTTGGVSLYFNSVNMTGSMGTNSTTAVTTAIYVGSGASALDLRNNVFVNTQVGTSTTQKNYAIYSAAAASAFANLDDNDYFVSNTFNAASAIPGFLSSDRLDLAGLKAGFGQNTHSFIGDPLFNSATDLHITSGFSPVSNAGTPIAGVTIDLDGETRNVTAPDVGADEYTAGVLPSVTASAATAITAGGATLGGNVTSNGGSTLNARGVVYAVTSVNPNPQLGGSNVVVVNDASQTTGTFSESVTGLAPSTGYSFVAFATNSSVGTAYTTPVSTFSTLPPPPTVTAISPSVGSTLGGTSITVTGTNFTGVSGVTIGGAAATGVTVVNATTITATTPAGVAGSASVLVTAAGGTNGANALYTYIAPPVVTAATPSSGPAAGGQSITLTGTGFTGATGVTLGGTAASGVTVVNATTITATTPAHGAGSASVIVTGPGGSNGANTLYTYFAAPTVTAISPSAGTTLGGQSVTITGASLTGATGVKIGGAAATGVTVVNATTITATTPAGAAGPASVVVTTPGGSSPANSLYTYLAPPTLTAISPSVGSTLGGQSVTITGTSLTGATGVTIGGAVSTGVTVVNATTITATTPAGAAGPASVVVTTPGGSNPANSLYTYLAPPVVTAISPTGGPTAGGTSVTITGTNFIGATGVTIGGAAASGVTVVNATTITATTPAGAAGPTSVVVTTLGGSSPANSLYTYIAPPTVAAITPTGGPTAGGTGVTITGTNFTGATGVTIGAAAASGVTVVNDATITATTPAGAAGPASVVVTTPGGTSPANSLYTYLAPPAVAAISPTGGPTAGGTSVTITGTSFTGATGVTIGGTAATGVVVVNAKTITATAPAGAAGPASVVVTSPVGASSANALYTYFSPPVVAVNGGGGAPAQTTLVNFTGTSGLNPGSNPYYGSLVQGSDGNFYGMTSAGGTGGYGTVFQMTAAGVQTTLVNFTGSAGPNPGSSPDGGLVQGSDGSFYGMTSAGGTGGFGTVFKVTAAGVQTTLVNFTGSDGPNPGSTPFGGLVQGSDGSFYGMTAAGGSGGFGTVFKVTAAGVQTTLVNFTGGSGSNPGTSPYGGLVQGSDGSFYGMTSAGGTSNLGTVFKITGAGAQTTLVNFTGNSGANPGSSPFGSLVQGSDGNFYGMTQGGGTGGQGTVFKVTAAGVQTTLVSFTGSGGANPGSNPDGSLVQGSDGSFYGTTQGGGTGGLGTVFKVNAAGMQTTLVSFTGTGGANPGSNPYGSLVQGSDGSLYGTTWGGGTGDLGTVFKLTLPAAVLTLAEGTTGTQAGTFSDAAGNATVTLTASTGRVTQNNSAGTWSWSPAPGFDGPSSTTVTITAADTVGQTASAGFTFTAINAAPAAAISAPLTVNERAAVSYTFTATDPSTADQAAPFSWSIDYGDGTGPVTVSGISPLAQSHTFANPGTFSVTAAATDQDGGASAVATRVITVADITPPVIAPHGNLGPIEATKAAGADVIYAAATATDNSGVAPTITYSQASGSTFAVGITIVTITAMDAAANASSSTFTVTVVDTTPPAISVNGPNPITVERLASYTDAGATATDLVDRSVPVTTTGAVNTAVAGQYTLTYLSSDTSFNTATATRTVKVVDTTPPSLLAVSLASSNPSPSQAKAGDVITLSFTASEAIQVPAVTIAGHASITPVNALGNAWAASYTVTASDLQGAVAFAIAYQDLAGNQGATAMATTNASSVTIDTQVPTVAIGTPSAAVTTGGPVTFTVTYTDANFGASTLATADITLNKTGTANAIVGVTGSGNTRVVTLSSITGDGTLGISIAAGSAFDVAGNSAPGAGPSDTFVVDNTAPTVVISTPSAALTRSGTVTYTVTYADTNFSASTLAPGDITLNKTNTANATIGVTGSGPMRTVTLSSITGDGALGISIAAGAASDLAGNTAPAAGPSPTFTADNTPPTVTIGAPSASLTRNGPVTYVITYGDANFSTSTLAPGDLMLNRTGTANATVGVTGAGATRTVTLSSITGDGTLGISMAGGTASDLAGNAAPAAGPSATIAVDNTAPTLTAVSIASSNANRAQAKEGDEITIGFTASEAIQAPAVTIAGHAATVHQVIGSNDWTTSVTVSSGDQQGAVSFSIAFKDAANNSGAIVTASTDGSSVTIDTVAPAAPSAPALAAASDTGVVGDNITSSTTPTFTGTAEAGATVTLLDSDGLTVLGAGKATAGSYRIATSALAAGSHSITATAKDLAGNTGAASAGTTVMIVTATPPAPSAPAMTAATDTGSSSSDGITNNPTPSFAGTAEAGATVTLYDSDGVTALGTGVATTGAYTITSAALSEGAHTLTTKAANVAGTVSAASGGSSVLIDTTAPVVTAPASQTVEATGANGATVTYPAAMATDELSGPPTLAYSQASGTVFPIGLTTVTITATDVAGNTGTGSFAVTVVDTTAPVITVPANLTAEATGPNGAPVTFSVSATDAVDGVRTALPDHASGSIFPLGTTTVNVSASDAHGHTASNSFTVTVRDTTPPVITTPGNLTATSTSAAGAVVSFTVSATDAVAGVVAATANPASGSTFPLGTTTVTVSSTDGTNPATATFTVTVNDAAPVVAVDGSSEPLTFAGTQSMSVARTHFTATALGNGKVLVVGGSNDATGTLKSAELYDAATGTWAPAATLGSARDSHQAVLLGNGKVLVVGGNINGSALATAQLYDPASGLWTDTGSLATARSGHSATLLANGMVLVAGGVAAGTYLDSAELYDPATGAWSSAGHLALARRAHTATLLPNGTVLVAAGAGLGDRDLDGAELYDPATNGWAAASALAGARREHTATLLANGQVLVAGGFALGSNTYPAPAQIYHPATGTWTTTGSVAAGRQLHTATLLSNGRVLIVGGCTDAALRVDSTESYDPATGAWSASGSLATARMTHTATALRSGHVLIAGGESAQGKQTSAELSTSPTVVLTVPEGSPAMQTGTFSDGDGNATVTLTVSSGTISQDNAAGTWRWTATGPDGPATSTVTVTATGSANLAATASFTFTVANVAPAVSAIATPGEDTAVSFSFTAADPSSVDQAAGFAWTIDYGDGSAVQSVASGTASPLPGAHTYPHPGAYSVTATASDKDGATGTSTIALTIAAAPVKGGPVPGGGIFGSLGTPEAGAFSGTVQVGRVLTPAIFAPDGSVLLKVGGTVGGLTILGLGAPSGDAVLVALKTGGAVTSSNNVALVTGLSAATPVVAARMGTPAAGLPAGVTIGRFLFLDGCGRTAFALVTLQGRGVTAANNLALCAIGGGFVRNVVTKAQKVTIGGVTRPVTTLATLVGSPGTLAGNRWRVDDDTFGVRVTFPDQTQAIFAVPGAATSAADWLLQAQTGPITSGPLTGMKATSFGLPGFGSTGSAQVTNLALAAGSVTLANNAAVTSGREVLARKGQPAPDGTGAAMNGVLFRALLDPLSGAGGAVAFEATLSGTGVGATNSLGLWYAQDGLHPKLLARTGLDAAAAAPGGGHWQSFKSMVLPDNATLGPIFLATLATNVADGVSTTNNLGLWAVDRHGTLRLLFRTGQSTPVNGVPKQVKTFTALTASAASVGAASGYDAAGNVAILATFLDGTQALITLTVP